MSVARYVKGYGDEAGLQCAGERGDVVQSGPSDDRGAITRAAGIGAAQEPAPPATNAPSNSPSLSVAGR